MKTCPYCRQHKNYLEYLRTVKYHSCGYIENEYDEEDIFRGFRLIMWEKRFYK
jgi:glutaredoxin